MMPRIVGEERGKWKRSANLQLEDKYGLRPKYSSLINKYNIQVLSPNCGRVLFKNNVTGNNWLLVITQCWFLLHDETEIVAGM